ncbi:MAG: pRL2-8 [Catenulispora sp.]
MALRKPVEKGACIQCWTHAYDPDIHRRLKWNEDCHPCLDHKDNGCPPDQIQK